MTYYLLPFLAIMILLIMYFFQDDIRSKLIIGQIAVVLLILITPTTLALSINNFIYKKNIPIIISIVLLILSSLLVLIMSLAYLISGVGMVG